MNYNLVWCLEIYKLSQDYKECLPFFKILSQFDKASYTFGKSFSRLVLSLDLTIYLKYSFQWQFSRSYNLPQIFFSMTITKMEFHASVCSTLQSVSQRKRFDPGLRTSLKKILFWIIPNLEYFLNKPSSKRPHVRFRIWSSKGLNRERYLIKSPLIELLSPI